MSDWFSEGWAIKYSNGSLSLSSANYYRTDIVQHWDKDVRDSSYLWKNISRRIGHKIVRVKLVEVQGE
jgi:hypothetical protein